MTQARKTRLKNVSTDPKYQAAMDELFVQPRQFLARHIRHLFDSRLLNEPGGLAKGPEIPRVSEGQDLFRLGRGTRAVTLVGVMTEAEHDVFAGPLDRSE